MSKVNIDGREFDLDQLSQEAKEQLQSLQYVEAELARLVAQQAIFQTARSAYAKALIAALPTQVPAPAALPALSVLIVIQ